MVCAHGDTVLYPLACVNVEVDGQVFEVQAAVADKLPLAMLLGTDVPVLPKLLGENFQTAEYQKIADALVVTRAQARNSLTRRLGNVRNWNAESNQQQLQR